MRLMTGVGKNEDLVYGTGFAGVFGRSRNQGQVEIGNWFWQGLDEGSEVAM